MDRKYFGCMDKCKCGSRKESALRSICTSIFRARTTLMHPRVAYKARTLTLTLTTGLHPKSALLSPINGPCSALRRMVKVHPSGNSLTRCKVSCGRMRLLRSKCFSCPTVRGTLRSGAVGLTAVRHSGKCRAHPDCSMRGVNRLVTFVGRHHPSIVYVMSGYCNRFIRHVRPDSINTSVVINSLVGGPNNKLTPVNKCITKETSLVRGYTCHLASPKLNGRINTALNIARSFCRKFFLTPAIMYNTLGNTAFTTGVCRTLKCPMVPGNSRSHRSVVRTIALKSTRNIVTFYGKVRTTTPMSDCMDPRP